MWKVPLSNKMAANYFVPPVNFCVCSLKLQNITEIKRSKSAIRKPNPEPSTTHFFFCLCTTVFFFAALLTCNTQKNNNRAEN